MGAWLNRSLHGLAFGNALAIMIVQPMVGQLLLPTFGGIAFVWIAVAIAFQACLVLAATYASWLGTHQVRHQQIIHGLFLATTVSAASVIIFAEGFENMLTITNEGIACLGTAVMVVTVFLASHTALFHSGRRAPDLYSTGNVGCLVAAALYLLVVAPSLDTSFSLRLWGGLTIVLGAASWLSWRYLGPVPSSAVKGSPTNRAAYRMWFVESMLPSALLVATTTYLGTFVAATPLIYLGPLALYLLSFALAFHSQGGLISQFAGRTWPRAAVLAVLLCAFGRVLPWSVLLFGLSVCYFLVCFGLHRQVYEARPLPNPTPEYFRAIGLGGLVGSLAAGLGAALLITSGFELPLAFAISRVLWRPGFETNPASRTIKRGVDLKALVPKLVVFYTLCWILTAQWQWWGVAGLALAALLFRRPLAVALAWVLIFQVVLSHQAQNRKLWSGRSMYGTLAVRVQAGHRVLAHGDVVHGRQDPKNSRRPLSYYHRGSGLGSVVEHLHPRTLGAVGLGAGTVSAYLDPPQTITYFEIDPLVVEVASNERLFTYLSEAKSRGVTTEIKIGDGRKLLEQSTKRFDLLIIDAFQAAGVPTHLLTAEALNLFVERLTPGGVLLFHMPTKLPGLGPMVARWAQDRGRRVFEHDSSESSTAIDPSHWLAVAGYDQLPAGWQPVSAGAVVWRDQRASIWQVF